MSVTWIALGIALYAVIGAWLAHASWRAWRAVEACRGSLERLRDEDATRVQFHLPLTFFLRDQWRGMPRPPVALWHDLSPGETMSGAHLVCTYLTLPLRLPYQLLLGFFSTFLLTIVFGCLIFWVVGFGVWGLIRWLVRRFKPA